jgi:transcriptional regulator with XRE-family HTH domain
MGKEKLEPSEVRKRLATTVARLRKERNLSQSQLAQAIGENRYLITDIETGRNNINQDTLDSLATFFETSVDVLLGRVVSVESEGDSFTAILKILQTLPQAQKDAVSQVLTLQLRAFGILKDR